MQFCGCLVCENLCIIFEQVQFCSAGTPLLTMLHQDYLLPVPSNRPFTQAEATSLQCLCHFDVNWPHFNPRKKYVKTSFHDITARKRDVSGHIHPKRLLKHFFGPICLLDMSLNQNKPKISGLHVRTKHSYCIFRLSIQASRDKSWNVKWTTGSLDPWFSGLRIECQLSFLRKQKERVKRQYHVY